MIKILMVCFAFDFTLITSVRLDYASAFVIQSHKPEVDRHAGTIWLDREIPMELCMNLGPRDEITTEDTPAQVKDRNGKFIEVGSVVRVAVEGLKAYQVPQKAWGIFNDDKEFVPAPEDAPSSLKNLLLPIGIRGVVTKLYDNDSISANFPIQVKLAPSDKGGDTEEGYDPPVFFTMHFGPQEIECT